MTNVKNLMDHWVNIRAHLLETMDKFGDTELDFRPFPTPCSVCRLMLRIAHEENGEFNL